MIARVFYVTQGSLQVWQTGASANHLLVEFADDDDGIRKFDRYLAADADRPSTMLVDVIEEEFFLDTIPKLSVRDRVALIRRRGERKFRRTPYRVSMLQGKSTRNADEFNVVHTAISNHELVDPWLKLILRHKTPISGVYSVPLMASNLVRRLFSVTSSAIFVAQHQGHRLRQVFSQDGQVRGARLSLSPAVTDDDYAEFVITETTRSRRYLERTRLLGAMETLNVCIVADAETAERISSLADTEGPNQFHFMHPAQAAQKLGVPALAAGDHFEEVFLYSAAKKTPRYSYATDGENRYWVMRKMRFATLLVSTVVAATCSVIAAILLSDAWVLKSRNDEIQSQAEFLAETFRREHDSFNPVKAGSHEMQLAVDTGDYLLANRVPVPWVMNQLGVVLGDYPDVRIHGVRWQIETSASDATRQPHRAANAPVSAPTVESVSVVVSADLMPFDGDMRFAFSRIDALVADLQLRTDFQRASAVEYPFDASTTASVSGEVLREGVNPEARFQIRLSFDLHGTNIDPGSENESI